MGGPLPESLLEIFDRVPPAMCRLAARTRRVRGSPRHHELAKLTGIIGKSKVGVLSSKMTWRGERIEVIEAFSKACGVNLLRPSRVRYYLKTKLKDKIKKTSGTHKRLYLRILQKLNEEYFTGDRPG